MWLITASKVSSAYVYIMSVYRITQKVVDELWQNFPEEWNSISWCCNPNHDANTGILKRILPVLQIRGKSMIFADNSRSCQWIFMEYFERWDVSLATNRSVFVVTWVTMQIQSYCYPTGPSARILKHQLLGERLRSSASTSYYSQVTTRSSADADKPAWRI